MDDDRQPLGIEPAGQPLADQPVLPTVGADGEAAVRAQELSAAQSLPSNHRPRLRGAIAILVLLGLAAVGYATYRGRQVSPTAGFLKRTPVVVDGLDQPQVLKGSCINQYTLQADGITDGQQHYHLTIDLSFGVAGAEELAASLAAENCTLEHQQVTQAVTTILKPPIDREIVSVSYRTKSGTRIFLPE